jgi:DNA-binding MarR family transcriptional regulator
MPRREILLKAVADAGRASGASAVMLHMAMSEKLGLGPADGKAYDLLLRRGPLTAGELGIATGLTSGSVTALIDRLEAGGYVYRQRDQKDRRKVHVHADPAKMAAFAPLMTEFLRGLDALHASYDDAALQLLADYMQKVTALADEAIAHVAT